MSAFSRLMNTSQLLQRNIIKVATGTAVRNNHGRPIFEVEEFKHNLKHHMQSSTKEANMWLKVFWMVMAPGFIICAYLAYAEFQREAEHMKHRKAEDYIEYPYLAYRRKPFPWGDGNKNLFFHPYNNWVPGVGYTKVWSEEHPGHGEKH